MMRIVHAADLHIDSPLTGLSRYAGAPVEDIRAATRRATENLVQFCERNQVSLLLLAGDLFDGDWRDYTTGLFFSQQMTRLKQAGVAVVLVRGNHDAASQIRKHLTLPDNVVELSHDGPETRRYPELGVAVHGQSYARRAETDDLARSYPDAEPGWLNIGLLHTCVTGRAGHEPYAPCKLATLLSKGYDYWALGHVHQREVLHEAPWVVFSGNLQGRHVKEVGAKGATVIDVADGRIASVRHQALDVVRWAQCRVSAESEWDADQIVEAVTAEIQRELDAAGERVLVVRATVSGQTQAHGELASDPERWEAEVRARAAELSRVWVESVRFETQPAISFERLAERGDALGQLARSLCELGADAEGLRPWLDAFSALDAKLPSELRQGAEAMRLDDPETLAEILPEVQSLLLTKLAALGERR